MSTDGLTELTRLITALPNMIAEDRALHARRLINQAKTVLSEVGDEAVAEVAATTSYREAAITLGVSESAINKAVTRHRQRSS